MSSSMDLENVGVSAKFMKNDKPQKVKENYSREFEDNSADLSEGAQKGNGDQENAKNEGGNETEVQKETENLSELGQEEKVEKTNSDKNENIESNEGKEVEAEKDQNAERAEGDSVLWDKNTGEDEANTSEKEGSEESNDGTKVKTDEGEGKSGEESSDDIKQGEEEESKKEEVKRQEEVDNKNQEKVDQDGSNDADGETSESGSKDQAEILKETSTKSGAWSTQSAESEKQKSENLSSSKDQSGRRWKLCKVTAGPDYIPCLDNLQAIKKLPSAGHYEHRERHCPDEAPTCLVPLPEGYRIPVKWPQSREKIWFANVPHTKLADVKGHQNWVHVSGEYLTFPGGGTQFTHGALSYIDFIQKTVSDIAWGKRTRVILDVGCGVASFGGYLFERDVLTMSLAPKDEHEAQVQFALERGIPAISAVMGTKRLPFPGMVFDVVHCARCRVPWHAEGGKLLLELNRVLRPGGYFVWSATPVYRKDQENVDIWKAMSKLTKSMCWELVKIGKDKLNDVSAAIYRKPTSNDCYEGRTKDDPPLCQESDSPNAAWEVPLEACMHKVPTDPSERGSQWPAQWPSRVQKAPYWLEGSEVGVYGKAAPKDFMDDYKHWKLIVANSYLNGIGIDWSSVRNVMDMRATYGGFAAALKDLKVWVMNVVPVNSSDTLPIIYERGLFGMYHNWCESFSTYPRSYDLLHADHLFFNLQKRCKFVAVMAEVDRILRPEGSLIVRDNSETIAEVESMVKSLHWKIRFSYSKDDEGVLCIQKTRWRPSEEETIMSAIA